MAVIGIAQQKGGAGKTTLAVQLGVAWLVADTSGSRCSIGEGRGVAESAPASPAGREIAALAQEVLGRLR